VVRDLSSSSDLALCLCLAFDRLLEFIFVRFFPFSFLSCYFVWVLSMHSSRGDWGPCVVGGPVDGRFLVWWVIDNVVWTDSWLSIAGAGCGLRCSWRISSIPPFWTSFDGIKLGYGLLMSCSYYPQSLVQVCGAIREMEVWIWGSWPAGVVHLELPRLHRSDRCNPWWVLARVNVWVSLLLSCVGAVSSLGLFGSQLACLVIWGFLAVTSLTGVLHRPDRCGAT
jgi:hypothetical protein